MSRIILGIDPGTAITGFGVICDSGQSVKYLDCGYISTSQDTELSERLLLISQSIDKLVRTHRPDLVAVESLFFGKNRTTAIAVAQARGVVLAMLAKHKLTHVEFTPTEVKQAVTGYGRAGKRQVQAMVKSVLNLEAVPQPDDSADALAVAICAAHTRQPVKIKA